MTRKQRLGYYGSIFVGVIIGRALWELIWSAIR